METCGFCSWDVLETACGLLDTLLYDLKSMDPEKHKVFTGVTNELILENLRKVRESFPELPVCVRTPIIPGFNDRVEDIRPILEHIQDMTHVWFEALDYHRMGKPKYEYLGLEFPMGDLKLNEEKVNQIRSLLQSEFAHLRSPRAVETADLRDTASKW